MAELEQLEPGVDAPEPLDPFDPEAPEPELSLDAAADALQVPVPAVAALVEVEWAAAQRAWPALKDLEPVRRSLALEDVVRLVDTAAPKTHGRRDLGAPAVAPRAPAHVEPQLPRAGHGHRLRRRQPDPHG